MGTVNVMNVLNNCDEMQQGGSWLQHSVKQLLWLVLRPRRHWEPSMADLLRSAH